MKRQRAFLYENIQLKKRFNNFILLIFAIFISSDFLSKVFSKIAFNYLNSSIITIKITGVGTKYILNNAFPVNPLQIFIEGIHNDYVNYTTREYNFVNETTTVRMIFDDNLDTCENMFKDLSYITEIDLSCFNSYNVRSMKSMFEGCTSLASINFTNINTQNVIDMEFMFYECSNLISLSLSNFKTSNIKSTNSMFYNCAKLTHLDLSYLDFSLLETASNMFYNCLNLVSLDLSHITTSQLKKMDNMFNGCSSLGSLNLLSFKTHSVDNMYRLFYGCKSLKSLNINNFKTSSVVNMAEMFSGCLVLTSLDLSNFDTQKISNMEYMFYQCYKLTSLDLSSFNTEKVEDMNHMFYGCQSLLELNLSNFKTNNVKNMNNLFEGCIQLTSLDLSNFNTYLLISLENMFSNCQNLISLNLSTFNTEKVLNMENMFYNCRKLEYVNLSSFDTTFVNNMKDMFSGCKSLLFLNISNFKFSSISNMNNMFQDCNSLIYINLDFRKKNIISPIQTYHIFNLISKDVIYCINGTYTENFLSETKIISQCENICFNDSKIIVENRTCIKRCRDDPIYKYFFYWRCFQKCPLKTHISYYDDFECEKDVKCYEANIKNCEKKEGHYVDGNDRIYKRCQNNCRYCDGPGDDINNNCKECRPGFTFLNESNKEHNCYPICNNSYYYFDYKDKHHCTNDSSCPVEFQKYIPEKDKCIHRCNRDNIYQFECENNKCCINCTKGTKSVSSKKWCNDINKINNEELKKLRHDIEEKEELILDVIEKLKNGSLDNDLTSITKLNKDIVMYNTNLTIQLSKLEQNRSSNSNYSSINLAECEKFLRNAYNISNNVTLLLLKFDYYTQDSLIPIIGYEVFNPEDMSKLNLSYCNNISTQLTIPVKLDENNLFQYDPNNEFYQDKCSTFTSEDGTDILISDRKKMFRINKMSLCEFKCNYAGYDNSKQISKCICDIKNEMETISDIESNPDKLFADFSEEEISSGSSSLVSMDCSKILFTAKGLKNNISSYILLAIIFYHLFSLVVFIKCGFSWLKQDMNKIIRKKENSSMNKNINRQITRGYNYYNRINVKNKIFKKYAPPKRSALRFISNNNILNKRYQTTFKSSIIVDNSKRRSLMETYRKLKKLEKNQQIKNNILNKEKPNLIIKNNKPHSTLPKNIQNKNDYIDYELNSMIYSDAILYDHRTCFEYYRSLLRTKHPFLFGFCRIKDYNLMIIKSDIFFISFSIYYAINFLLLTEEIIHYLFENGGKYNILDFIEPICISFAISHMITIIIKLIFLSERNIMELKMQATHFEAFRLTTKIKKHLVIKYFFFFIIGLIFLIIFWVFLSSFGAVFKNTQIVLLKNTLISFSISFIYPFIYNIIPCFFRICSLSNRKNNCSCVYNTNKFLQLL